MTSSVPILLYHTTDLGTYLAKRLAAKGYPITVSPLAKIARSAIKPRQLWIERHHRDQPERTLPLLDQCQAGDVLVEFGYGEFVTSRERAITLAQYDIGYIDVGMAGNVWGIEYGFAMAVGGAPHWLAQAEAALNLLAPLPNRGWLHAGGPGCGHFIRQIHALLEQTMLDSLSQFSNTLASQTPLPLEPARLNELWQYSSNLRDTLLSLVERFMQGIDPPYQDFHHPSLNPEQHPQGSPANQLAQVIQFAAHTSRDFETRLAAKMRLGEPPAS